MWLLKNESHQSLGRKKKIGENISKRDNNGMCNDKDSAHMPLEGVLSRSVVSDCGSMDWGLLGSSASGISQARILE